MGGFAKFLLPMLFGVLAGCGANDVSRAEVTLIVDTPQGERRGSAIWAHSTESTFGLTPNGTQDASEGEAVVVELPDRLLLLLRSNLVQNRCCDFGSLVPTALLGSGAAAAPLSFDEAQAYSLENDFDIAVGPELYPAMVTLTNPLDPLTIRKVDQNNPQAALGAGVSIKEIRISSTRKSPQLDLADRLPWLADLRSRPVAALLDRLDSPRYDNLPQWAFTSRTDIRR